MARLLPPHRLRSLQYDSLAGESFYTDRDLSEKLKISRRSLQDYRNEGRIPFIRLGGKVLYRASDIDKLLDENYREKFR